MKWIKVQLAGGKARRWKSPSCPGSLPGKFWKLSTWRERVCCGHVLITLFPKRR
jgi:hypothetical protein